METAGFRHGWTFLMLWVMASKFFFYFISAKKSWIFRPFKVRVNKLIKKARQLATKPPSTAATMHRSIFISSENSKDEIIYGHELSYGKDFQYSNTKILRLIACWFEPHKWRLPVRNLSARLWKRLHIKNNLQTSNVKFRVPSNRVKYVSESGFLVILGSLAPVDSHGKVLVINTGEAEKFLSARHTIEGFRLSADSSHLGEISSSSFVIMEKRFVQ